MGAIAEGQGLEVKLDFECYFECRLCNYALIYVYCARMLRRIGVLFRVF